MVDGFVFLVAFPIFRVDENKQIWRCYRMSDPAIRGYKKRMHIWHERNIASQTEQRPADQIRGIMNNSCDRKIINIVSSSSIFIIVFIISSSIIIVVVVVVVISVVAHCLPVDIIVSLEFLCGYMCLRGCVHPSTL